MNCHYFKKTQPIITLLTDFGLSDSYVGAMKGVMLLANPKLKFVDITHEIPQGKIKLAAFRLFTAYQYFPKQTIHLVVVDPGVGTKRNPIIVETPDYYFVGPDNGVFSWIYAQEKFKVYKIDINRQTAVGRRWTISNTFHGRDIFAPTAASLSLGIKPATLGSPLSKWSAFKLPTPVFVGNRHVPAESRRERDKPQSSSRGTCSPMRVGTHHDVFLQGEVIDIDRFGNLITNISKSLFHKEKNRVHKKEGKFEPSLEPLGHFEIKIGNHIIRELKTSYEGTSPIAIFGSSGFLEISLPNGNCADFLHSKPETKITIAYRH